MIISISYLLASSWEGDWDLRPPIPERSTEAGGLDEEDAPANKSLFEDELPWKNSFILDTIWSDRNLEPPIELPTPDEGVVGGADGWLVEEEETIACWGVPDGGEGESVSIGTNASSWFSFRLLPLLLVNPSHITESISAAFSCKIDLQM